MKLPYEPMTEQEEKERNLLPSGEYQFVVDKVEMKKSAKKDDMLELTLLIDYMGKQKKLKDWVLFSDEMKWKLRHLAKSLGVLDKYDLNLLEDTDLVGKYGFAKVTQKMFTPRDGSDPYMVNGVTDYLEVKQNALTPSDNFGDKDVPF